MRRDRGLDLEDQFQALGGGLLAHQVPDILQDLVEIEVDILDRQLARLDLREIENVVDDAEQVLARTLDLQHVVALARRKVSLQRKMRQSNDRVHRRPDLVAHIGEEDALGFAGLERRLARLLELDLSGLAGKLRGFPCIDVAPRADHLHGPSGRVADQMLLVGEPAIGAVLAAEAVFHKMLSGPEQLGLFDLDVRQVVRMHARAPEVCLVKIVLRRVAQHGTDAGADEGRGEVAVSIEAVNDNGRGAEQHIDALSRRLARDLGLLTLGDVRPRPGDLDRLALLVAHDLLAVMHPEIGAVRTADAIFDRPRVALVRSLNPGVDARNIIRMNVVAPKMRIGEIFAGAAAEQAIDAVADKGRLVIALRRAAVDNGRRGVQKPAEMSMRRGLNIGDALEAALFLLLRRVTDRLLDQARNGFGVRLRRLDAQKTQDPAGDRLRLLPRGRHD